MNAEILAVGTELLMGQIANTNAQYISKRLPDAGINVYYHSVAGDNPVRLKECLQRALERSDVVIMTGGLGPTQDDLTKETVAQNFNRKLILHQESLDKMQRMFGGTGRQMTQNNVKQAYLPEGCLIIPNNNGTAPGCIIEEGNKVVILLPGPPSEMKPMFEDTVMPYFIEKSPYKIQSKYLRVFGIGESALEDMLTDLIDAQTNPTIATYAKDGEVTVRVTVKCGKEEDSTGIIMPVVEEIGKRVGNSLYSIEDHNLEEEVGELLIGNNISLSTAESCTGGLISARLTDIAGISAVYKGGVVSYSNEAKADILGVRQETLERYGAVSKETAMEMAEGVRRRTKADIGISVTGIAGPGGGTAEKPVGLVYIGLADEEKVLYKELKLRGNRARIRNMTVLQALNLVRLHILEKKDKA